MQYHGHFVMATQGDRALAGVELNQFSHDIPITSINLRLYNRMA